MKIKTEKTFDLDEADVKRIVAQHLAAEQGVEVTAKDVTLKITDSVRGSGHFGDDDYRPAKLDVIVVARL